MSLLLNFDGDLVGELTGFSGATVSSLSATLGAFVMATTEDSTVSFLASTATWLYSSGTWCFGEGRLGIGLGTDNARGCLLLAPSRDIVAISEAICAAFCSVSIRCVSTNVDCSFANSFCCNNNSSCCCFLRVSMSARASEFPEFHNDLLRLLLLLYFF